MVVLLRNYPNKRYQIEKFRPITLLSADFKILVMVLTKRLPLVIRELIGDTQTCAIPSRSIHENRHPIARINTTKHSIYFDSANVSANEVSFLLSNVLNSLKTGLSEVFT